MIKFLKFFHFIFLLFFIIIKSFPQYVFKSSEIFQVKVNGKEVFTEYFKTVEDELTGDGKSIRWPLENVSICHFQFSGTARIEVTCTKDFKDYNLSPKRYSIPSVREGNTIIFTITRPGKFNINMDNDSIVNEQLFIFADLFEDLPDMNDSSIINIMNFAVDNKGGRINTDIIQAVINSLKPGETLFFPSGQYLTGTLILKSNMGLYFQDGAILLGTEDYNDYKKHRAFILIDGCNNTFIKGYGRINLRGEKMQKDYGSNLHVRNILITERSSNIVLEDFFSLDPPRLNIQISGENVSIRNVKALSTQNGHNTDGIDPWDCCNILYDNIFIYGRDDAIAVKSMKSTTKNITVVNSIFSSLESTMKVGTETRGDSISNIRFENCDAIYAGWAMSLWSYDGAEIYDVSWRNIGVERLKPSPYLNQGLNIYFTINPRNSDTHAGNISKIICENIYCDHNGLNFKNYINVSGCNNIMDDIIFRNFYINDTLLTQLNSSIFFNMKNSVGNFSFVKTENYCLINLSASNLDIESGESSSFIFKRTGNNSSELRIFFSVKGNARNGIDYELVPDFLIMRAGENEKTITVKNTMDKRENLIKQVAVSLLPDPEKKYMIGTEFISVMNLHNISNKKPDINKVIQFIPTLE